MHVLPPNPQTPFDMEEFLHMSSSYDMDKVIRMAENVPPIPRHVPSEWRPGGESRREILKSRAKNISRSVCETIEYATSRTISEEDTTAILETFSNVRQSVEMLKDIWYLCHLLYLLIFCIVYITYVTYFTYRIELCWIPWESYAQQEGQAIL